ncbi:hypothetical protein BDZ45DRAFT_161666 [Acephala macrosclerotiorum]|nr:hypothetical protein BDZ45DRAFT_161666 [Acephala macrosclerotiorum]
MVSHRSCIYTVADHLTRHLEPYRRSELACLCFNFLFFSNIVISACLIALYFVRASWHAENPIPRGGVWDGSIQRRGIMDEPHMASTGFAFLVFLVRFSLGGSPSR